MVMTPLGAGENMLASAFVRNDELSDVEDGCASETTFVGTVHQMVSYTLCWGNARMYDCSLPWVAPGVGRGFMLGFESTVDKTEDV